VPPTDFFSGGLEMLFSNESKHKIQIPGRDKDKVPVNIGYLVRYLCDNTMKDKRKELFVLDGSM
jgi:ubiquitin related modifier 1